MRKKNKIIMGSLIGSLAILAGVISYAILDNQAHKEESPKIEQEKIADIDVSSESTSEEIVLDELVFQGDDEGYTEEQTSIPAVVKYSIKNTS